MVIKLVEPKAKLISLGLNSSLARLCRVVGFVSRAEEVVGLYRESPCMNKVGGSAGSK